MFGATLYSARAYLHHWTLTSTTCNRSPEGRYDPIYRMAGNFGGKIFWRIAENMSFGGIYFGS